jgi:hypothetical protein
LRFRIDEDKKIVTSIELERISSGSIIGLEDLYHGNANNSVTVTVTSQKVELFEIERDKFWKEVSIAQGIKPLVEMKDEKYKETIVR